MVFEHIEKLKRDYTDKYVLVDDSRPELARFKDTPGRVKTVNMSGRALVEFDAYANIGWYDIDVDYLKVIERPVPKEPEQKAAPTKKPAAAKATAKPAAAGKKLSPLEMARMQGAAGGKAKEATQETKPAATQPQGKLSTADVLAAARGGTSAAATKETPAAEPAAATKDTAAMSVAEKIAMLRGDKGAAAAADAKPEAAPPADATDEPAAETTEEEVAETPPATPSDAVDRASMSVEDMIAWCRQHDVG